MSRESAWVVLSGGQDSATCLLWALKQWPGAVSAISFDYGQRHKVELDLAASLCRELGVPHEIVAGVPLDKLAPSALTDKTLAVAEAGGLGGLPSTFVPGRNILFLSMAGARAAAAGSGHIVIGACETDFSGYPDCREEFMKAMELALSSGLGSDMHIHRPLMFLSKAQIFGLADDLGGLETIIERTHTCYLGERTHRHAWGYGCGECPACRLRKKGYEEFLNG